MDESTRRNCAAGIKRDASFTVQKTAVTAFVNLVCRTSMPSKKDAMDKDQIGERRKAKKAGDERNGGETNEERAKKNKEASTP